MDIEILSNRILDGEIGSLTTIPMDNSPTIELIHHGIKGMKWGVRKDKERRNTRKAKKSEKRLEGESDSDYRARMNREYQERLAKISAKSKEKSEARTERMQARALKSQERQAKMQIKAAERQLKAQTKAKLQAQRQQMRDTEKQRNAQLKANIQMEKAKAAIEKEKKKQGGGILTKTLIGAGTVVGGIALAAGKEALKKQLTELGNQKIESYLVDKKGWMKRTKKDSQNQNKKDGNS